MIISLPFETLFVLYTLRQANVDAYIVGGAVRDILINSLNSLQNAQNQLIFNQVIADYDFTTNAPPEKILKIFPDSYYENEFGTVATAHEKLLIQLEKQYTLPAKNLATWVELTNQPKTKLIDLAKASKLHQSLTEPQSELDKNNTQVHDFEITTYRSESLYTDFRHPSQVSWGKTIQEDLNRRDFTINAMALKIEDAFLEEIFSQKILQTQYLIKPSQYQLIDEHNGMKDLSAKQLNTVGETTERFQEDALRMLRAIRFAVQLKFNLTQPVLEAIKQQHQLIKHISGERIRDELLKMLASDQPKRAIELLDQTELLAEILPELISTKKVDQAGHHTTDVWVHSLNAVQACPNHDPIVRLATLLHDIGKASTQKYQNNTITFYNHEIVGSRIADKIGKRLKLSKKQLQRLFIMVRYHMFYYQPDHTDASIRRFMRKVGLENVDDMLDLREADRLGSGSKKTSWRLEEMKQRMVDQLNQPMEVTDLAINGHDLMEKLQLKPGPILGEILNQLLEIVLENPAENEVKKLLALAKELIAQKNS